MARAAALAAPRGSRSSPAHRSCLPRSAEPIGCRASRSWKVAYGEPFEPGEDAQEATERLMRDIERLHETL